MKENYIYKAYREFEEAKGCTANFLFTGGAIADAVPLSAFLTLAAEHNVTLQGLILCPYYEKEAHFFSPLLTDVIGEDRCMVIKKPEAGLVGRSLRDSKQTIKAIQAGLKRGDADQSRSIWNLSAPFFLLAPSDGYISPDIVEFLFLLNRPIVYVLMDDGIGAYVRNNHELAMRGIERMENPLIRALGTAYVWSMRPWSTRLQALLESKASFIRFTLFQKEDASLILNRKLLPYYRDAFKRCAILCHVQQKDFSDTVIAITTKSNLLGFADIELEALTELKAICDDLGLHLTIKPHPLDNNNDRYEALGLPMVQSKETTFEMMLSQSVHFPVALVGFGSAAQIWGNIFFEIPAILMTGLVKEELDERAEALPSTAQLLHSIRMIEELYSSYAEFPKDAKEFKKCIEAAMEKSNNSMARDESKSGH